MGIIRQVEVARTIAAAIVRDDYAQDVAQDVAVKILEWGPGMWTDSTVARLAAELAHAEVARRRTYVSLDAAEGVAWVMEPPPRRRRP